MKRRFGLPAAFALALLALLFFGFTKKPVPPSPAVRTILTDDPFPPLPVDLQPEREEAEKALANTSSSSDLPELPDHSDSLKPRDFVMLPPPERLAAPGKALLIDVGLFRPGNIGEGEIAGTGTGVIDATLLDNSPRARAQLPPVYPSAAKAAGLNGEVVVEFVVNQAGRVLNPRVVRSSDGRFDESTLRAVAKWVFEPGRKGNRPVAFRMMVPVVFRLGE